MKRNIYVDFTYLVVLAASFGAVITLGALVAPVIFNNSSLGMEIVLDRYNAGMMMAEIFRRFSYWLYGLAFYVLIYELYMYKLGQRDRYLFISASVIVFTSLMFSAVYSPKILAMQDLGREAIQSDTFVSIHKASEIDFKILAIALLVLFIRRLMLMKIN